MVTKLKKCFCRQGNEEDFPEPESDTVNMSWSCEKNALKQYRNKKGFAEDHMKDYCLKYLSNAEEMITMSNMNMIDVINTHELKDNESP